MKRLRHSYGCPVELSLEFLGGKWKTVILAWLKQSPHRYHELRARMPGIADKVLTQRLKELEGLGLVSKTSVDERPSIYVYELTERGDSLRPILDSLHAWGVAMATELDVKVAP